MSVARLELIPAARQHLDAGGSVVLHGPVGIGKSHVLRTLAEEARERGESVLRAELSPAEHRLPLSTLADLLDPLADAALAGLPAPQRAAVRALLRREQAEPGGPDELGLRLGVPAALRDLSMCRPVLLAIDGAQWVDGPSAEVLTFVARHLDPQQVRVVVTETTEARNGPVHGADLCPRPVLELELPPLTFPETRELLARRGGGTVLPHWLIRQIHDASAGNPRYALEIARALDRLDELPPRHRSLPVPAHLRARLSAVLRELDPAGRRLLLTAGVATRPTVELLRRAGGQAEDAAGAARVERTIAFATAAGILDVVGDDAELRFTQPLFAAALEAAGNADERRAAHARLTRVVPDPVERARHLALATQGPDECVAATLMAAAERARRRGSAAEAASLARLAVARTPAEHPDRRCERSLVGAGHAYAAADYELTRELARRAVACAPTSAQRVRACVLIITAANQALHDLDEVFADAFAHVGDDPRGRARLHYLRACKAHITDGDTATAWVEAARAAALACRVGDRSTEQEALALQAFVGTLQGRPDACEPLGRALARPQDAGPTGGHNGPRAVKARLDFFADRLVDAGTELDRLVRRAKASDDTEATIFLLCATIDVDVRAGRCDKALETAREVLTRARDMGANLGQACYSAAVAEAAGGELARAAELARESVAVARADQDQIFAPLALCLLGQVQLRTNLPVLAVEYLSRARAIAARRNIVDPVPVPWSADLAEALIAVGDHDRAHEVVREVQDAATRLGRRGVYMSLSRADALLRAESADPSGAAACLRETASRHRELGLPIEQGRDLLALGVVERRRRRPTAALAAWRDAAAVFEAAAARPWLEQARAELGRVESARGDADDGPPEDLARALTPAEHRVVELVGEGATNREVAARLFLSAKTVEATLTRVYRKLGIRSRADLIRLHARDTARS